MILPVILLLVAAVALGLTRSPMYTAHALLVVGGTDVSRANVLATGGSAESLAAVFARAVSTQGVVAPVGRQLGMSTSSVSAGLSGSPIPKSNLVQITAQSRSVPQAVRLANSASTALIVYANTLDTTHSARLAFQLKQASFALTHARRLQSRLQSKPGAGRGVLDAANASVQVAAIRVHSLASAYQSNQSSTSGQNVLQPFDTAAGAASDRRSKLELLLVAALIAGCLIGAALGLFRASQVRRNPGS